ncbi:MAG: hypothetical protein R6U78_01825 [Bacteroidales bacterium]
MFSGAGPGTVREKMELSNGWFYSIVPRKVELFDGNSDEGIGLAPDIQVKNRVEELSAGVDRVLETAIETLSGE